MPAGTKLEVIKTQAHVAAREVESWGKGVAHLAVPPCTEMMTARPACVRVLSCAKPSGYLCARGSR